MLHRFLNLLKFLLYDIKIGIYLINNKRFNFASLCKNKLVVQEKDLSYFTLSANTITIINKDNEQLFFREVLHHEAKPTYFKYSLDRFLKLSVQGVAKINFEGEFPIKTQFSQSYVEGFASWLHERFISPKDYKLLSKSDYVLRRQKFSIWNENGVKIDEQSLAELNLGGVLDSFEEIAPLFLSYIGGCAYCYRVNKFNRYETYYAQKSIASYEVAKALGKQGLITEAIPTQLVLGQQIIHGVLSPRAIGIRAQDSKIAPTPVNQRDLSCLWLIDALCNQPDHAPNNYNVISDMSAEIETSICAFDNDNMFTFFPIFNINHFKSKNCSKIISSNGLINLPHLDKEFAETLLSISLKELDYELKKYLNIIQLAAFRSRFKGLRRALRKTITKKSRFLLEETEWCDLTMQEERSGKYGRTYLTLLYEYIEDQRRYLNEEACE